MMLDTNWFMQKIVFSDFPVAQITFDDFSQKY